MPVTNVLKEADIFYELTNTQLELVASICEEKTYQEGALIFAENTTGDELYVIADGEVNIEVDPALIGRERCGRSTDHCDAAARAVVRGSGAGRSGGAVGGGALRAARDAAADHPAQ